MCRSPRCAPKRTLRVPSHALRPRELRSFSTFQTTRPVILANGGFSFLRVRRADFTQNRPTDRPLFPSDGRNSAALTVVRVEATPAVSKSTAPPCGSSGINSTQVLAGTGSAL